MLIRIAITCSSLATSSNLLAGQQISLEDVERIAGALGFRTIHRETVSAAFNQNLRSMMQMSYRAAFWTMVKEGDAHGQQGQQ